LSCSGTEVAREDQRRVRCVDNLRELGSALRHFADAQRSLPAGSEYGKSRTPQWGYSWLFYLLPDMENAKLFSDIKSFDKENKNQDPTKNPIALEVRPDAFVCSAYAGPAFVTQADGNARSQGGITNYKGIGATTLASLNCATAVGVPRAPYGRPWDHPDGVLFPGRRLRMSDISDGASNTLFACETIEPLHAQWHVGRTASLAGLPPGYTFVIERNQPYYAPKGFTIGQYEENSTIAQRDLGTYLSWDYEKAPYDEAMGMKFGPSSAHARVVNHAFCDGDVRGINRKMDVALYMFLITRSGGDPASEFFPSCP